MLSAVLDTNVLASGALTSSSIPRQLLNEWRKGYFKLYISNFILEELKEVFEKPFFKRLMTEQDIDGFVNLLETDAIPVQLINKVREVATHPEDDFILATAVNAKAEYLVTGDRHLQDLEQFKGINIISPRTFSEIIEYEKAA
ncbi:MAG: putative toxin-antitoxin system toxin component, PIN family [Candidatus Levybacteria bacterium RIFCSPHIGHO2_01_FULL_40_15b]|nr:MAG: putative toxin-antitoxin system toxin component, PIN family [Candidatus Levybacteria bacterium RIFCSPHIGHO2_01_FULL_40_15b]